MSELEYVISRIISIDKKTSEVKKNTLSQMEKNEININDKINSYKEELLSNVKIEADEKYETKIKEASIEAQSIINKAEGYCETLNKKYCNIKDELLESLVQELFN